MVLFEGVLTSHKLKCVLVHGSYQLRFAGFNKINYRPAYIISFSIMGALRENMIKDTLGERLPSSLCTFLGEKTLTASL